jgi:hypothetical protein
MRQRRHAAPLYVVRLDDRVDAVGLPLLQTWHDFREFVAAKKRKREPLRFVGKAVATAHYRPSSPQGLANFRAALRGVGDWGLASERVDACEHALRTRHACGLPMPRKVLQNSDRSLSFFWEGAMVRFFVDGVVVSVGGKPTAKAVTRDLLDMLAFQARIQGAA